MPARVPSTGGSSGGGVTDPISTANVITSTVASGSVALRIQQGAQIALDGASTRLLYYDGSYFQLSAPLNISSGTESIFNGGVASNGAFRSAAASGSVAFRMEQGARLVTNGSTASRYISDDGTQIVVTGNVNTASSLSVTGNFTVGTSSQLSLGKTNSITARAGGGQALATALVSVLNFVTTVASANDSVLLPTANGAGRWVVVFNLGANAMNVYPFSGQAIDALGTDNPYSLAAGASREFYAQTGSLWISR